MVLTTLVRRSAACVSLAVAQALHTRCDRGVRFGVVADVQYCDIDDARNFAGTEVRFYRGSLDGARRAARGFEEARLGRGLDFVAQLGTSLTARTRAVTAPSKVKNHVLKKHSMKSWRRSARVP